MLSENYILNLSIKIKNIVLKTLDKFDSDKLQLLSDDLKGKHSCDREVYKRLKDFFLSNMTPANIFIEGEEPILCDRKAGFTVFIDPIDGSINRDLGVGDPGIVVAYSMNNTSRFNDIFSGYVYGLHSGDIYYSVNGKSFYQKRNSSTPVEIRCDDSITSLNEAILYYNDGYGSEFAKQSFRKAGALPFFVQHHNAFDNTALEICQICRGAAHIRVEARSYESKGTMKGSDHANILTAFAIGKGARLIVTDLNGSPLDNVFIELDKTQDFICCSSKKLLFEAIRILKNNKDILKKEIDDI